MRAWLIERFGERSTWASLAVLAGWASGVTIAPQHSEAITSAGLLVAGFIGVATKERKG